MRYSKLFGKTVKQATKDISAKSHELLYKGGFIRESTAGRYFFLPLGQRVMDKIIKIVEDEMANVGSQKMYAPVLHPLELWKETNRTNEAGFELMKITDRRGGEFALGGTAEEMFVDVVRKFKLSYKDLPLNLYQFGQKFRDEMRARGGLLRVREFIMKDAYTFDVNEEAFTKIYDEMADAYTQIFNKVGFKTVKAEADGGYIGGQYAHEYIVESEVGESRYFTTADGSYIAHEDVAKFDRGHMNPDEEVKDMVTIEQPEWVQTMDDNMKHYNQPKWRFLKNVVYKNRLSNEIIIVTIRGDLEVNKTKVERELDMVGQLEDASAEDLSSFGSKTGFVHSWGHKNVRYIADLSLKSVKNFIGGQKEETNDANYVNYGRDFEHTLIADLAMAYEGAISESSESLLMRKGIEVGNIFQLGYHYSSKMRDANFISKEGKSEMFYMGCYGIGIGRTLATVVEKFNDKFGIIWPISIAPYQVSLISIGKNEEVLNNAKNIYENLMKIGVEVLWDDRDEQAGTKFADADLIGNPIRILVSEKTLAEKSVEVKIRHQDEKSIIILDGLNNYVEETIAKLRSQML